MKHFVEGIVVGALLLLAVQFLALKLIMRGVLVDTTEILEQP
jgi:hypothetical protein